MSAIAVIRSAYRGVRTFFLDNTLELLPARKHWRHYSWARLRRDLIAGFNVSLLSIAQGLAFASLAGVPVAHGLACAAVASLVGPLLASSRHTILGPTNATSFLVFSGLAPLTPAERAEMLPVLIFFAGALLVVGAYFRLADLLQYVSRTVIVGYLAGSALLIMAAQMEGVAGLPRPETSGAATFFGLMRQAVSHLQEIHWSSLLIAFLTWLVYALLRWKRPGLPAFALALVAGSLVGWVLQAKGIAVETLRGFSARDLLPVMPDLADPSIWDRLNPLFGVAFAIAFLAALENSIMAKSLASRTGDRLDSNQEMLSVGAANLACSFLSGMPASGSLVRSALNYASGAVTQASSIFAGAICAVAALTLGGVVGHIPRAALAILVICVAMSLFNWRHLRLCFRATRSDASTLVITFVATLLMPLQVAIFVGVGVSILLYLRKAARPELVEYEFNSEGALAAAAEDQERQHPAISIVHVEGDLFFGAAELFRQQIQRLAQDPSLRVIILRMKYARHLDATSAMALEELVRFMRAKHRHLLLSGVTKDVYRVLKNSGLVQLLGRENIFPSSVQKPNLATRHALKRAQELLGHQKADIRIFHEPGRPRPA